ncbi:MAG: hypothetical protein HKM93_05535 [Desulfobacteraceae bacterium]|nr:hypothetical protein [Desulfobacteraceae bacterium]
MPLVNFGAIMNFAEEIETLDMAYYQAAAGNPACEVNKALFEQFAKDAGKNIQTVKRTRRENVTEMILEGIQNFTREPFQLNMEIKSADACHTCALGETIDTIKTLEERAERYYQAAADKMKALPEVARALKLMGKKRSAHLKMLDQLS